jgi:hypothetical protein
VKEIAAMANAMIERVARLISEADRTEAGEAPDFADWHWEERADLARAILRAIGEPTENMCGYAKLRHPEISREQARGVWVSMMDEAINGA